MIKTLILIIYYLFNLPYYELHPSPYKERLFVKYADDIKDLDKTKWQIYDGNFKSNKKYVKFYYIGNSYDRVILKI